MVIVPDPPTLKVGKLGFPLFDALKEVEEALLGAVKRGHRFHGTAFHLRKQQTRDDSSWRNIAPVLKRHVDASNQSYRSDTKTSD